MAAGPLARARRRLGRQSLSASRQELLTPAAQQRLRDVVLATDSATERSPRSGASTSSSFCAGVNLRYILASLIEGLLSIERPMLGGAPDGIVAPPGLLTRPGNHTQLPVNATQGSRPPRATITPARLDKHQPI